jgi:large subunit ribosomal protein L4
VKLQVKDIKGGSSGEIDVRDDVFGVPEKAALVHQVVVGHLANRRQGTVKTKTRSEVSGGGAKPRPQKHSGRSRQGSIRSPIWVGGGRAFGPNPRSYRKRTPKKMRRLAILSVLSDKVRQGTLVVVDNLDIEDSKTKSMKIVLEALQTTGSALVVTNGRNDNVVRASGNLQRVKTLPANVLNTLDLINKSSIVMTVDAVRKIEETWGGVYKGERVSDLVEKAPVAADDSPDDSSIGLSGEDVEEVERPAKVLSDRELLKELVEEIDTEEAGPEVK